MKQKRPRRKKCRSCREWFQPERQFQDACSPTCAIIVGRAKQAKLVTKKHREEKHKNKPRPQWMNDAKKAFNAYIRERDRSRPCISCGRTDATIWNAGHYRPAGNCSALRFDEDNVHKQCARPCNKDLSGNLINYRLGLLERVGVATVDRLEKDHPPKSWSIDELRELVVTYKGKLKTLRTGSP